MSRTERGIDVIEVYTKQHQFATTVRTDTMVRATTNNSVRRTLRSVEMPTRF